MQPAEEAIARLVPDLPRERVQNWLETMPERYTAERPPQEIADHLTLAASLDGERLFRLSMTKGPHTGDGESEVTVTVVAWDYAAEFSVLTGVLAATGFNVTAGDIYTSRTGADATDDPAQEIDQRELRRVFPNRDSRARYLQHQRLKATDRTSGRGKRIIVDSFTGRIREPANEWLARFEAELGRFIPLLHRNTAESLEAAKQAINELVVEALAESTIQAERILYPVDVEFDTAVTETTRMKILSEDTPFFLYALSSAIALHGLSIEHVEIRTNGRRIEDSFDLVDATGAAVQDEQWLNQLRLSVAFTKQFTYFLHQSPDPYRSLQRFETMIQDFIHLSRQGTIGSLLSSPKVLQDLARLLGASDYLWEDFLRLQYETVLPMLDPSDSETLLSLEPEQMTESLQRVLADKTTRDQKRSALNDFKDNQNYLIDLDHIRNPSLEFFFLSTRLTALAEAIVNAALDIAVQEATERYGTPRSVAGLPASWAVMGLGKLGGEALGYASDIELMFLYSDDGRTDGSESIENREYFNRMFQEAVSLIEAKREGIFHIDLRLRPHGNAGPVAVSLASFARYYSREAVALERLALVRMRRIGGDRELAKHVQSIRDDLIYSGQSIDLPELKRLRALQLQEKSAEGRLNAKFSPGGLVDLEYSVQILQVIHGCTNRALRTPRIHRALHALVEAGRMHEQYAARLVAAYRFFRILINGLRMLRGNAQDLFLPELDSLEYLHLARRMGYQTRGELSPAEQLHMEFEARSADVRAFVERELGRDALPGSATGNIADLILTEDIDDQRKEAILSAGGFTNIQRAYRNWSGLAGEGDRQFLFAELAILAWDVVRACPDPDMALNNWETFVEAIENPEEHLRQLQTQPQRLRILIAIFAGSQFLSDTLIQNPDFLEWATAYEVVRRARTLDEFLLDLQAVVDRNLNDEDWLDALRRFRRREVLRIGTRDICLHAPLAEITAELSDLACALTRVALDRIWSASDRPDERERFCVLAFGKLGGGELNYSSDIDLLALFDPGPEANRARDQRLFDTVMMQLRAALSNHTAEGYLYRVDLRLRPFGSSGTLAQPTASLIRYYEQNASLWEHQALLKLRPIAGALPVGWSFLEAVKPAFFASGSPEQIRASISSLRDTAVDRSDTDNDVKNGVGGIRDIEFLVQGLQMIHGRSGDALLSGNTLQALAALAEHGSLDTATAQRLSHAYVLLRRVEHFLQILEDRQVHRLPSSPELRTALAKRMKRAMSLEGDFYDELGSTRSFVRECYLRYLMESP
ncbi:MAG: glutamate-ammonia-ligase adenylyltransferase [Spirochaetaceae bacterium]|nr:MAG: glutamate-ammonia-ligase adenylyltransferase [Spirochaetaceae bacterium]